MSTMRLLVMLLPVGVPAQTSDALTRAKQLNSEVMQLYRQGRYADAIPKAREALAIRQQALGPAHPAVALSLNNLALLLWAPPAHAGNSGRPIAVQSLDYL